MGGEERVWDADLVKKMGWEGKRGQGRPIGWKWMGVGGIG